MTPSSLERNRFSLNWLNSREGSFVPGSVRLVQNKRRNKLPSFQLSPIETLPKEQACPNQKEQQQQINQILRTIERLDERLHWHDEMRQRQEKLLQDIIEQNEKRMRAIDERLTNEVSRLEERLHWHDEMRQRQEKLLQDILEQNIRLQCGMRFCNGRFIWRIEHFLQCCNEAITGAKPRLYSPSFYIPSGYKLCMRINLNGVGNGEGKHVALYVHIVQGDFDDNLDWPFPGKFTLSILDQSDQKECRRHIRNSMKAAEPNLNAFQRPTAPYNNMGFGYQEFASIEQIREPQYVKNNTLLVTFEIIN